MNEKPKPLLFKRSTGKNAGLPCTRLCQMGHVIFVNELHNFNFSCDYYHSVIMLVFHFEMQ